MYPPKSYNIFLSSGRLIPSNYIGSFIILIHLTWNNVVVACCESLKYADTLAILHPLDPDSHY